MEPKTREILQAPFDQRLVRERTGPGGRVLSYVEVSQYIARLNEAFEGDWTYEITETKILDDEAIVQVRLSVGGMVKMALGGAAISRRRDNGKPVSLAHDLMAAEAAGLKRACRLLGIGASLYEDDEPDTAAVRTEQPGPTRSTGSPTSETPQSRITNAQIGKLRELVSKRGEDWQSYRSAIRERLGVNVDYADRSVASRLISELIDEQRPNGQPRNGAAPPRVANGNSWRRL
jgi:hypothetical protein